MDTELRGRLRELANERRRFSYRRLFAFLSGEGEPFAINWIYRPYREEGLTVRKRARGTVEFFNRTGGKRTFAASTNRSGHKLES